MLNPGSQIIAAILTDPDKYLLVCDILGDNDFTDETEAGIWRGMRQLNNDGKRIDVESLLAIVPGSCQELLVALGATFYRTSNILAYAKTISSQARSQRLWARLEEARESEDPISIIMRGIDEFTRTGESTALTFNDLMRKTIDFLEAVNEGMVGIPSGIPSLDDWMGGWQKGRLVVVAARPSIGKTALTLQMAIHAAAKGYGVGICSLEMSAHELGVRSMSHAGKIDVTRLFNAYDDALGMTGHALDRLQKSGDNLSFNVDQYTLPEIVNQIRLWVKRDNVQMAVVDHIGLVEVKGATSANDRISLVTRTLKKLAKDLDIPIIAVSQLNRGNEKANRMPVLSDLRDSGSIEQDADVCLFIHRDEATPDIPIYRFGLLKNRQGRTGWIGRNNSLVGFDFIGRFQEFREITIDNYED